MRSHRALFTLLVVCLAATVNSDEPSKPAVVRLETDTTANPVSILNPAPTLIPKTITDALPAASEKSDEGSGSGSSSGGGVFKPSEDISEDFAVPFPVDI